MTKLRVSLRRKLNRSVDQNSTDFYLIINKKNSFLYIEIMSRFETHKLEISKIGDFSKLKI